MHIGIQISIAILVLAVMLLVVQSISDKGNGEHSSIPLMQVHTQELIMEMEDHLSEMLEVNVESINHEADIIDHEIQHLEDMIRINEEMRMMLEHKKETEINPKEDK